MTPDGRRVVSASSDKTLKVWDLASGRAEATLEGHADRVTACAVTPDGSRVVSASADGTLKVWDLQAGECLLTHRANATCHAIATTATGIIAGDAAGAVWFLDWPSPDARQDSARDDRRSDNQPTPSSGDTRMTTDDLFDLLSKLLPAQFEAVLFRARVPIEYLPAATAPQSDRAIATIRYFELRNQLDQLARTVQQVVTGGGQVGTDPR
jgi:hypothetical protein